MDSEWEKVGVKLGNLECCFGKKATGAFLLRSSLVKGVSSVITCILGCVRRVCDELQQMKWDEGATGSVHGAWYGVTVFRLREGRHDSASNLDVVSQLGEARST